MGQVGQGKPNAHMRIHRAGSYVENTIGGYIWQKERCRQRCKGPSCGQTARLDDAANDIIYCQV